MESSLQRKECRSREIASLLEAEIISGKIPPGAPLASVRTLAEMYGVGPRVIVSALAILSGHRLIQSQPRRGFRVADPLPGGKFLIVSYAKGENGVYFLNEMIPAFESVCRERGIGVDQVSIDIFNALSRERILEMFRKEGYTGALLGSSGFIGLEPELQALWEANIPVLLPDARPGDREITRFAVLERPHDAGWFAVLSHLREQGYRRIGAVGELSGDERAGGHRDAWLRTSTLRTHFDLMRKLDLEIPEKPVLFIDPAQKEAGRSKFADWLENRERFDAVVCHSDLHAAQLYEFCEEKGIDIPEELAVAAFGNSKGTDMFTPPLTSVDFLPRQAAEKAFGLLFNSKEWFGSGLEAPVVPRDFKLILRASTARVKKKSSAGKRGES